MSVIKSCLNCGIQFKVPEYRKDTAKFCSKECLNHGQYKSIEKICPRCNIKFSVSNSRVKQIYCSDLCCNFAKTDIIEKRKASKRCTIIKRGKFNGKTLRKFVFDNKPKECELCGYSEYDFCLDIHHVDKNPNNNNIDNLAVLCAICHKKHHKGVIDYAIEIGKKQ